jgi:hypothetical protein
MSPTRREFIKRVGIAVASLMAARCACAPFADDTVGSPRGRLVPFIEAVPEFCAPCVLHDTCQGGGKAPGGWLWIAVCRGTVLAPQSRAGYTAGSVEQRLRIADATIQIG